MGQKNHCNRMINSKDLPLIPDKLYFSIGEVARLCSLEPHVLRYWEQEFPQLSPTKRRGNRRYYQQQDIVLVSQIKSLLYEEGLTINGARARLNDSKSGSEDLKLKIWSQQTIAELEEVVKLLKS